MKVLELLLSYPGFQLVQNWKERGLYHDQTRQYIFQESFFVSSVVYILGERRNSKQTNMYGRLYEGFNFFGSVVRQSVTEQGTAED